MRDELKAAQDAVLVSKKVLDDACLEEENLQIEVGILHAKYEEANQELEQLEKEISLLSSEISDLKHLKCVVGKESEAAKLESKKITVQVERLKKERVSAEREVSQIMKKYAWIESERSSFGVKDGDYDFEGVNLNETRETLSEMQVGQETLVSLTT